MNAPAPTTSSDSPDALCGAILADARQQAAAILARARAEAGAQIERAKAEAGAGREARLQKAHATAARRREGALAAAALETARYHATRLDQTLERVREALRKELSPAEAHQAVATVTRLAAEALRQMPGCEFILTVAPEDAAVCGAALPEVLRAQLRWPELKVTVKADPRITRGGVMVCDVTGQAEWDNRLEARLERLWPELRLLAAQHLGLLEATPAALTASPAKALAP